MFAQQHVYWHMSSFVRLTTLLCLVASKRHSQGAELGMITVQTRTMSIAASANGHALTNQIQFGIQTTPCLVEAQPLCCAGRDLAAELGLTCVQAFKMDATTALLLGPPDTGTTSPAATAAAPADNATSLPGEPPSEHHPDTCC